MSQKLEELKKRLEEIDRQLVMTPWKGVCRDRLLQQQDQLIRRINYQKEFEKTST